MIVCTLWESYAEINAAFGCSLNDDDNAEDPALLVTLRKWTWDYGDDTNPPCLPGPLGALDCVEHVKLGDKTDLFIYAY